MLDTANRPCRALNSSSRNCSGSPSWPEVTRCSSGHTWRVTVSTNASWPWAKAETIAYDSSNADLGRSRPASIRPSTARVSRWAASGVTAGLTGPWTVTIASTDELVQLDVVDMATLAELRSVLDDEDVVRVGADLGHGIALDAGPDRQGVEAEHLRQHPSGLLIANGDIDPDESVVTGKQPLQLPDRMLLDAVVGHKANVHPARHLLGALVPAPVRRRRDHPGHAGGA